MIFFTYLDEIHASMRHIPPPPTRNLTATYDCLCPLLSETVLAVSRLYSDDIKANNECGAVNHRGNPSAINLR
jgi:hypothetical protein